MSNIIFSLSAESEIFLIMFQNDELSSVWLNWILKQQSKDAILSFVPKMVSPRQKRSGAIHWLVEDQKVPTLLVKPGRIRKFKSHYSYLYGGKFVENQFNCVRSKIKRVWMNLLFLDKVQNWVQLLKTFYHGFSPPEQAENGTCSQEWVAYRALDSETARWRHFYINISSLGYMLGGDNVNWILK